MFFFPQLNYVTPLFHTGFPVCCVDFSQRICLHHDVSLLSHRTIIHLSIVSVIGQVLMTVSSIHDITDFDRDGEPNNANVHVWVSTLL